MTNLRAGLLSGLIAVLVTSAVNLICRLVGVLPDQLDIKHLAELFIDPARLPAALESHRDKDTRCKDRGAGETHDCSGDSLRRLPACR